MRTPYLVNDQQLDNYGQLIHIETENAMKACDTLSKFYHSPWQYTKSSDRLKLKYASVSYSSIDFNLIEYGVDIAVKLLDQKEFYSIILPIYGSLNVDTGNRLILCNADNALIVSPMHTAHLEISEDCKMWLIRIRRDALEEKLQSLLGREINTPVIFDSTMTLNSGPGASWLRTVNYLKQEVDSSNSLYGNKSMMKQVEQILLSGLLCSQTHTYSDALCNTPEENLPAYVTRAESFITKHATDSITSESIVKAAGVPKRTLYAGFKRHLGTSPMSYLTNVRMSGARRDLLNGDLNRTITHVALKWGFNHLSRFSVNYRTLFGESPSETLKVNSP